METKNTLEIIYIDLSKLSGEQIKEIGRFITESGKSIYEDTIQVFTNLTHNPNNPYLVWEDCEHAWMDVCGVGGLTELTYPEFIKLFEGGESDGWTKIQSEADLPPYNKWVIAYTKDGGNHIAYFDKRRNEWVANSKFGDEITHWRHQPEPPKF